MRIAYVCYNITSNQMDGGVGKKIRTQIKLWKEEGCEVGVFFTGSNIIPKPAEQYFPIETSSQCGIFGYIHKELNRIKQMHNLLKAVFSFHPDIIYIRHGIYTYPLHRIFNIAPVVFEINALDLEEIKKRSFLHKIIHIFTRNWILNKSSGIISVSNEIAAHPSVKKFQKPAIVVANGIAFPEENEMHSPGNVNPRIIFSVSEDHYWQGLDKLILLASLSSEFIFEVVGVPAIVNLDELPENINFHGFISDREVYEKIISNCDVGIGPLAWHRKNMTEGSPLKVREYLAKGIPVISAHQDSDIPDSFPFLFRLPNTEDNVVSNLNEIHAFIRKMHNIRVPFELIWPLIGAHEKEKKRLIFFQEIIK